MMTSWRHGDVMTWKSFPHDWLSLRSPVVSLHKGPIMRYYRYFLCCYAKKAVEQRVELSVLWDVMTLMRRHCNVPFYSIAGGGHRERSQDTKFGERKTHTGKQICEYSQDKFIIRTKTIFRLHLLLFLEHDRKIFRVLQNVSSKTP